jgi:hypothetical protein
MCSFVECMQYNMAASRNMRSSFGVTLLSYKWRMEYIWHDKHGEGVNSLGYYIWQI